MENRKADIQPNTKICQGCQKPVSLYRFSPRKKSPDGRENTCRECRTSQKRASRRQQALRQRLNTGLLAEAEVAVGITAYPEGDSAAHFRKVADLASALTGQPIAPSACVQVLMAQALVREQHRHDRKNLVEVAGYAAILDRLRVLELAAGKR